jgi:hypothetical protein
MGRKSCIGSCLAYIDHILVIEAARKKKKSLLWLTSVFFLYCRFLIKRTNVTTPFCDTYNKAQVGHNMFAISTQVFKSNQWQLRSSLRQPMIEACCT